MTPGEHETQRCNTTAVRRAVDEIWNGGNLRLADRLFDPAYINHGGLIPDLVQGPEAIKFSVALYRTAFPGLHITVKRLEARSDLVDLLWAASTPPSDESLGELMVGSTCSRLIEGQIVESWTTWEEPGSIN